MRCAACQKMHYGLTGLMPKMVGGHVPGTLVRRIDMLCNDCRRAVPIDQTSKDPVFVPPKDYVEREPGEDDESYPF